MNYRIAVFALLCAAFLSSDLRAEVLLLDDFKSAVAVKAEAGRPSQSSSGSASDNLGPRVLNVTMTNPIAGSNFARMSTGGDDGNTGLLEFESAYDSSSRSVSVYEVKYGEKSPLNLDLSAYPALEIRLAEFDLPNVDSTVYWEMRMQGVGAAPAIVTADKLIWHQSQFPLFFVEALSFSLTYTPHEPVLSDEVNVVIADFRAVPEPSGFILMGLSGIGLGICFWRRRKR